MCVGPRGVRRSCPPVRDDIVSRYPGLLGFDDGLNIVVGLCDVLGVDEGFKLDVGFFD